MSYYPAGTGGHARVGDHDLASLDAPVTAGLRSRFFRKVRTEEVDEENWGYRDRITKENLQSRQGSILEQRG